MAMKKKSTNGLTRRDALSLAGGAGAGLLMPQLAGRARAQDKIVIRHLVALNPAMEPAYKEVIAAFEAANPGVEVSLDLTPFLEAVTKASQAAAIGEPYDVIDAGSEENQWQLLQQGLLEPITDVVDDLGADKYFAPTFINKWNGEYWMAPYLIIPLHIEYRKDLFEAKNIKAPFTSWDEWLAAAKALTDTEARKYGFLMPLASHYFYSTLHASMLLGNGGHFLDPQGKVVFNSPETVQMLEFTKELAQYCVPNMAEQGADDMQTLFYKDVTAMTWYSDLGVIPNTKQLNPGLAGKVGIMPIPARTPEQDPVLRMIAQYYSIGKGSPNADVAKEYIKHLLKVENEVKIIKSVPLGNVPAIPAAKDSPDLWADPDIAANKQLYLDYIDMAEKYGRAIAIAEHPGVFNPMSGRIMSEGLLIGCVQDVVLNGVSAEEAAATWAAKMEELVAKG